MGVILKAESGGDLALNWWNWRPIVELLLRKGLIDDEQASMLQINGVGASLDATAAAKAAQLVDGLVVTMPTGSRVLRDGTIDTEERLPQPVTEMDESWYGASREALQTFSTFSADSGGFVVS